MHTNTESKNRPSDSLSNDSGVVTEESTIFNETNVDKKNNTSATIQYAADEKTCSNDYKSTITNSMQNGDDTIEIDCAVPLTELKTNRSPESTHISIESIDEDAVDSSVIDSDSDFEDMPKNGEFIIQKLGQHLATNDSKNGVIVVSQNQIDKEGTSSSVSSTTQRPQIGSIAVQNSTDITFGDKTFYQGPVTIKQFLLENNKWKPKDSNGNVNPAFDISDSEKVNGSANGKDSLKADAKKHLFQTNAIRITGGVFFIIFILITIVLTAVLLTKSKSLNYKLGDGDDSRINIPINSTIGNDNIGGGKVLRIVSRAEWVAQPARHTLNDLELPATKIIIAHTATENCTNQGGCSFHVRFIQTFHMESRNWDDISYNFLVGGDGAVYEGRGWNKEGAHTKGFNKRSICIAFIGTFTDFPPSERQLNAAKLLIEEGLRLKKLSPDYKLYGHRQLIPSESPGAKLFEIIKSWSHFSNDISDV